MKILLLTTVLFSAFAGGDRERGMQLYKEGKYRAAQEAFQAALKDDPDSAELQWNLALAAWRAGDLDTAELASEKYAALAKDAKDELHRGMLGAVRFEQALQFEQQADHLIAQGQAAQAQAAQAQSAGGQPPDPDADELGNPLPLLEKALQKALNARNHFVRGARANPTPEILRNTERALRKIDELKKRIEELMQQQQKQEQGDKNDDEKKPEEDGKDDEKKPSDEKEGDEQKDDKQKGDEQKENKPEENKDEKKPEGEQSEKKPDEGKSEKPDGKPEQTQEQGEGEQPPEAPEPKPGENDEKSDEPDPGKPKPGEEQKEPEGEEQAGNKEPEKGDGQKPLPPEPKPGESRSDAPGEGGKGLELTPEQAARLLERAKKLDEQLKKAKKRQTSRRRAVERDW